MNAITSDTYAAERQAFAELAKDFSAKKLIEKREEHDRYPFTCLMDDAVRDAGTVGFYGINLPADFGGVDMNATMLAAILEKVSEADAGMAGIIFANAAALEIVRAASADSDCAAVYGGIRTLGVEPVAFQSFSAPEETELPVIDGGGAVTGKVAYLALGNIAGYAVVPARHLDAHRFSYYLVDLNSPGVRRGDPVVSLGFHSCPAADITLEGAPAVLIGAKGQGPKYFGAMRDAMSVAAAAVSLGIMKGSFRDAMQYAADRYQGGRQIIGWGQVRMMLANMAVEIKIGESCLAAACRGLDGAERGWEMTAMAAAMHTGALAVRATADGVQLFGGNGYTKDYPQEKRMRDARQAHGLLGMALMRKMDYIARIIAENE
jgi:alkylation response protein AidB-like acyl-CoA dehydrogenase